ncbi:MAG TPA: hypothetical protein VGR67_12115 [Candidatus Polarisedimenticolia bacterium]|jgi:hypothetical protein|nr:hypothetical protein [Candidatus Polarisedimenticolia bacterium]
MKRTILCSLLGTALLALATAASAEELTVNSILIAHRAGATADGIIAVVRNPANTVDMTAGDLVTLRAAGVSETVIATIGARVAAPKPPSVALQPDDPRLVDLVRLIKSGISESIIAEQLRHSDPAFNLSVPDLLYLKQNGVLESIIGALMATRAGTQAAPGVAAPALAAPGEMVFEDLVLVRSMSLKKSRSGRLVMRADSLAWVDGDDPKKNFDFQINGLEKVWFTCQARTPDNFCYQINLQIVKGARYRFRDVNRESGSNASVIKIMDALRTYYPQVAFGAPDVSKE